IPVDVAWGHDSNDRPPTHHIPTGCEITDDKGPVPIQFEWDDKRTLMPLGDHASYSSNYLGELIREMPLYYLSWRQVSAEQNAAIVTKIGIGMPRLPSEMIPRTKPDPLRIAKTEQRARSYAGRDPGHLLAFEIKCEGTFLVLVGYYRDGPQMFSVRPRLNARTTLPMSKNSKKNKYLTKQVNLMMKLFRSDNKFSQILNQGESSTEFSNASGSSGCEDDEMAEDEKGGEDEEDEEDGDS
nr:hypothetical protein [Tanacetum cinerariifolium]